MSGTPCFWHLSIITKTYLPPLKNLWLLQGKRWWWAHITCEMLVLEQFGTGIAIKGQAKNQNRLVLRSRYRSTVYNLNLPRQNRTLFCLYTILPPHNEPLPIADFVTTVGRAEQATVIWPAFQPTIVSKKDPLPGNIMVALMPFFKKTILFFEMLDPYPPLLLFNTLTFWTPIFPVRIRVLPMLLDVNLRSSLISL